MSQVADIANKTAISNGAMNNRTEPGNFVTETDMIRAKETVMLAAMGISALSTEALLVRLEGLYWQAFKHALDKVIPEKGDGL